MSSDLDISASVASLRSSTNSAAMESPNFNLQDCLSSLNQKTELMLRTMRLDVVLLGSREEEMRSQLDRLVDQYELLERMLEDENAKKEEEGEKTDDERMENKRGSIRSTIDWNGDDGDNNEGKNDKVEDMKGGGSGTTRDEFHDALNQSAVIMSSFNSLRRKTGERMGQVGPIQLQPSNLDWSDTSRDLQDVARCTSEEGVTVDLMNLVNGSGDIDSRRGDIGCDDNKKMNLLSSLNSSVRRIFHPRRNGNFGDNNSSAFSSSATNDKNNNVMNNNENSRGWAFVCLKSQPPEGEFNQRTSLNRASSSTTTEATQHSVDDFNTNPEEVMEEGESMTSSITARCVRALRLKLRGLDIASSTLQQLLSYRTRDLYDLRYESATLQSTASFHSKRNTSELEQLRNEVHFAKVERRRKMRMLEDVRSKIKVSANQEERLMEELNSVRSELCRLRIETGTKDE
jgi:predicted  nucleic acid-binding Zn-ribbon protein